MKCAKCGREILAESAYYCSFCDAVYCPVCAEGMGICSCYGDLRPYN